MTMITSLSEDITKRRTNLEEYEVVYHKLHGFIDKLNEKIVSRIQLVQQVYLDDYKQQVSLMANQLKNIREVLDEELLKQRSNQRLFRLEQERDFFRGQVTKLSQDLKRIAEENNQMKKQYRDIKHQAKNYKKICYELETKIYKLTHENIEMDKIAKQNPQRMSERERKANLPSPLGDNQKKDYNRTHYTTIRLKPSQSLKTYSQAFSKIANETTKREQIIDKCIKEQKKEIYYRNLNAKSGDRLHFDIDNKVPFQQFTKTDKKELLIKILSTSYVLDDFYEFLFEKKNSERLTTVRKNDPKFNTMSLLKSKTQFSRKIFDIKANRS